MILIEGDRGGRIREGFEAAKAMTLEIHGSHKSRNTNGRQKPEQAGKQILPEKGAQRLPHLDVSPAGRCSIADLQKDKTKKLLLCSSSKGSEHIHSRLPCVQAFAQDGVPETHTAPPGDHPSPLLPPMPPEHSFCIT